MKNPRHLKVSREAMERWRAENPYLAPYESAEEAEAWAAKIRTVHRHAFRVIPVAGGFGVEQDLP